MTTIARALALRDRFINNQDALFTRFYGAAVDDYAGLAYDYYAANASAETQANADREYLYADLDAVLDELFNRLDNDSFKLSSLTTQFIHRYYSCISY